MLLTLFYRWTRRVKAFRLQAGDVRLTRAAATCQRALLASAADIPRQCAIGSFMPAQRIGSAHARAALLSTEVTHVQ